MASSYKTIVAGSLERSTIPHPLRASSPSDCADFNLHKYAIRNGFRMEKRLFPCTSDDYVIELTDKTRREEMVDMLLEHFLNDETLIKSLRTNANLTRDEEIDFLNDERVLMETVIDAGTVLLAIHKDTNRISGVIIVIIHDRGNNVENSKKESNKPDEKMIKSRVIKDFYYYGQMIDERTIDVYEMYPHCKTSAEIELVAINKIDRQKGLALDLYKAAISVIKEIPDVRVLFGTYTSIYSRKIAEKVGKISISDINIMEFTDKCGKPVFQDTEPHNILSIMAMEI